jgi:quercetin dioxygenase-like cupin family protein|tara:strand:+ start:2140 stop:2979 length:840 start_codon:yes stop_codon:yes gene_type:complete
MPIIKKFSDINFLDIKSGIKCKKILSAENLNDNRIIIDYYEMSPKSSLDFNNNENDITWIQSLSGKIDTYFPNTYIPGRRVDEGKIIFIKGSQNINLDSPKGSTFIITRIPNYKVHEDHVDNKFESDLRFINWGNEPILKSEHDDRKRVYLISETLAGTNSVKGELIRYPISTSCPEHFHVGGEHYQFITSGNVMAVLDGAEFELNKFDLLYNFENEKHWFYTKDSACDFVEFFVPGEAKTIWTQTTNICTWSPLGVDINGKSPARNIAKHVHGEGKNI